MGNKLDINMYKDRIIKMADQGYQSTQIAETLGVSNAIICKWRKQLGISPKEYYRTPESLVDQIAYMYLEQGMQRKDIAKALNVKLCTVTNTIMAKGLTRKSANCNMDKNIDKVNVARVEDPIYYVEHKPTMKRCVYHGKQYRDMTGILGG